jgi:hypothetical protein
MRNLLSYLLGVLLINIFSTTILLAQFNNEWIDYNKTYYKFKVGQTGLYRIPYSVLQSAGLGSARAEEFQLWRNGEEVPVYTSTPSGLLSASDFIEFFGVMNDGKPDAVMYKKPEFQLSDKWSLQTDTAAYFLTLNPGGNNLRLINDVNNIASNSLPPEKFFMHTFSRNFRDQINPGYAAVVGINVYLSSYDNGEGWSSRNIQPSTPLIEQYNNLFPAPDGPDPIFRITAFGSALNPRKMQVRINGATIIDESFDFFSSLIKEQPFSRLSLNGSMDTIRIINTSTLGSDRLTIGKYEITYPRTFNFGGSKLFEFTLRESQTGNFLEITNFVTDLIQPILYDLTNGKRFIGDIASAGKVRFALPPGGVRNFVLMNAAPSSILSVRELLYRKFINYSDPAWHANYLMIAHSSLAKSSSGDALQQYKSYRVSSQGGGHIVGIYDIDELVDQFAFGIKKHPLSVKNFIGFARANFSIAPKNILLLGKGITYDQYRNFESLPSTERINLVPTFGNPGSDNILASSDNDPTPEVPIGRLSVVSGDEIIDYLNKVKEHDKYLTAAVQTIENKAWTKNAAHIIGGGDPYLQSVILSYMNNAKIFIEDTAMGARVFTFEKVTSAGVDLVNSGLLSSLFKEGLGIITYFGHSSANSMEFNLDNPNVFENPGKYPLFIANGCNAGNFFIYDTLRATRGRKSITENYVLTPNRGSIGFLASTHFGIVNYLNIYTVNLYQQLGMKNYASTLGEIQNRAIYDMVQQVGLSDYFNVMSAEQILLSGDPAVQLYPHAKQDYVVEEPQIKISPTPVSITNTNFDLKIKYYNIGRFGNDSIRVQIKRELPGGKQTVLYDQKRPAISYADSITLSVPINAYTDKGQNRIIVNLDSADLIQEISELNNAVAKNFTISDDEVRPVHPYPFAIVNNPSIRLKASSTTFLPKPATFVVEVDTTELFNSPMKVTQSQQSLGGVIEFNPTLQLRDSLVFYWRVAKKPDTGQINNWAASSFTYLSKSGEGWSQSHYFQFLKDSYSDLVFKGRDLEFAKQDGTLFVKAGIFPNFMTTVSQKLDIFRTTGCGNSLGSLEFIIVNKNSGQLLKNSVQGSSGLFRSSIPCSGSVPYQFNFLYTNSSSRKSIMDFFGLIPTNSIVIVTNWASTSTQSGFINDWIKDTLIYGSNNSLYHQFKQFGFKVIDSFNKNVPMILLFEKDLKGQIIPKDEKIGNSIQDVILLDYNYSTFGSSGQLSTSVIGPSKKWNSIQWHDFSNDVNIGDTTILSLIGIQNDFSEKELYSSQSFQKDTSVAFINPIIYPYLKIIQTKKDLNNRTPSRNRYLQVKYDPMPEGSLSQDLNFPFKDSLEAGEPYRVKMSFKNISNSNFDSVKTIMLLTDASNTTKVLIDEIRKPIRPNDTISIDKIFDTWSLMGDNSVFINFNPDNAQPEQYLFNNYHGRNFYVKPDNYAPNLDVTFDGLHILNKDIVSPKPNIVIKLKDDSRYLALNDTSLFSIRLRYPDGSLRKIRFDNDTLQFTPSSNPLGGNNNTASLLYKPILTEDGEYELIIMAKDRSNNLSGALDYSVVFQVINKSMISNLLNYPNPFTTSTAFVFTLTGTEIPTYFRIQILSVTGKIIKEITKEELGPLKIGHNITEYKWDGRDQFGQPLANGVYLYRVLTDVNGKKLDKLKSGNFNTEKYFQSGYGKMYLMR